jgi:two-component system NtrC family sensor kinase
MQSDTGTWLYTFIPVTIDGMRWGAIEMSESLADKDRYIRATIWRTAMWTGILAAVTAALSMILGLLFVGRPVHRLIEKARDVARGNLRGRVEIRQNDELGELAAELNAMSDRLAEAYHRIDQEESAHQMTLEQLRHADRLVTVGKLASAVAHELGTPLNVILARARMAQTGEVSGEGLRDNNAAIVHQANRMADIIRQLLNFARHREPRKETIDLNHIIQQSVSILSPLARRRSVVIDFKSPGAPLEATVDHEQIQQVLLNIIVNGIEAMPHGGQLTISAEIYEKAVPGHSGDAITPFIRIRIRDSGEGIAPENIPRLFDPFFTTKGREEGTGLGLSISSNIVREHGGWIDVQSEIGKGTMFRIYLPKESTA